MGMVLALREQHTGPVCCTPPRRSLNSTLTPMCLLKPLLHCMMLQENDGDASKGYASMGEKGGSVTKEDTGSA